MLCLNLPWLDNFVSRTGPLQNLELPHQSLLGLSPARFGQCEFPGQGDQKMGELCQKNFEDQKIFAIFSALPLDLKLGDSKYCTGRIVCYRPYRRYRTFKLN